jgi:hypothetical protein
MSNGSLRSRNGNAGWDYAEPPPLYLSGMQDEDTRPLDALLKDGRATAEETRACKAAYTAVAFAVDVCAWS